MPPTTRRMMLRTPRSSLGDATADTPATSAAAPDGDGDGGGDDGGGGGGAGEWEVSNSSTSALPSTSATTATSGTSSTSTTREESTANAGSASHADRPSSSSSLRTPHIYSLRMPVRTGADPPLESSSTSSSASTSRRRPPSDDPSRSAPVPTGLFWSFDGPPGSASASASASAAASTGLRPPPGDVPQWRPAYVQPAGSSSAAPSGDARRVPIPLGSGLGRRSRNSGNNRIRFAPDSPSSLSSLSSPSAAENAANDEPRASGSTTTTAAATGPAPSTSTAAARRRALRIPSRLREGGEAPHHAIVIDDLLHSSEEDDDDFTVLSSHTNPATLDRLTDERLLRQTALGWPDHDLGRAPTPIRRPGDPARSYTAVSRPRPSVVVPRMSDQDRSNYRFIDGIPAGPHRYRHRDRAVHFASGGEATGSGGAAASASATATGGGGGVAGLPPVGHPLHPDSLGGEEGIMRHIGIYPPMRFRPEHRKVPDRFETRWTHPEAVQEGFSHSIVEPPIEVDMEPGALPTGPLPETTPICARCRYALQMGGAGDKKIWVLPCGHVIDGKCVRELSEPAWKEPVAEPGPEAKSAAAVVVVIDGEEEASKALQNGEAKANGKARAVSAEPSEGTPQKRTASMREDEEKAEDEEEKGDRVEDKDGSTAGSETGTPRSKRRHLDVPGSTTTAGETVGATTRGTSPDPIDLGSQSFEILYSTTSSSTTTTTTGTNGSSSSASASRREKGKGSKLLIDDEDEAVIVSGVKLQPVPFTCPVVDCGQLCFPKGDHDLSVIEMFI